MNLIISLFQTWILQATAGSQIQFDQTREKIQLKKLASAWHSATSLTAALCARSKNFVQKIPDGFKGYIRVLSDSKDFFFGFLHVLWFFVVWLKSSLLYLVDNRTYVQYVLTTERVLSKICLNLRPKWNSWLSYILLSSIRSFWDILYLLKFEWLWSFKEIEISIFWTKFHFLAHCVPCKFSLLLPCKFARMHIQSYTHAKCCTYLCLVYLLPQNLVRAYSNFLSMLNFLYILKIILVYSKVRLYYINWLIWVHLKCFEYSLKIWVYLKF